MPIHTRGDYLNNKVTHQEYYRQFVDQGIIDLVVRQFKLDKLVKAYEQDVHLNNIPLQRWDALVYVIDSSLVRNKLAAAGDFFSLAGGVCILKEAAKMAIFDVKPQ